MRHAYGRKDRPLIPFLTVLRLKVFTSGVLAMIDPPCQQDPRDADDAVRKLDGYRGWVWPRDRCPA